jgi:peptide/nickel transport system permease protein
MLATSRDTFAYAPWQLVGPAAGLVLAVAAASLIGDALRDSADPEHAS